MGTLQISEEEIYNSILEILNGERFYYSEELRESFIFTNPTGKLKLYTTFLEEQLTAKYIAEGHVSEKNLDDNLKDEFFSTEDQEELEEIESKLKSYKLLLKKRLKGSEQALKDEAKIKELEITRSRLLIKKSEINSFTAEHKSREDKYLELLVNCVLTIERTRKWSSVEQLLEELDNLNHLYILLNNYLEFYFGYDTKKIRKIARSNQWINYYINAMKTGTPLFSTKPEDYSWNQLHLISWSIFYSDIREMLYTDKPSDEIIDDDERLDKYLEEYSKKFKAEMALAKKDSKFNNNLGKDDQHLVVTAESENYIKFHKANMYDDPALIANKTNDGTTYNETAEAKKIKRKLAGLN